MEEEPQPGTSTGGLTTASPIPSTSSTSSNLTEEIPSTSFTNNKPEPDNPNNPSPNKSKKGNHNSSSDSEGESEAKTFECNICLDVAKDAVVSHCGHLFCWPCLHQWLETRPTRQSCPVCKAVISKDKVIPLYGRGGSGVDPRSKIPPRPTPTRTEQSESHRFAWGGNNDGGSSFHMSFGIGAFPFGFFASAFNWGQVGGPAAGANFANPDQLEDQEFLSKIFLWIAVLFIVWLLLA